MRKKAVALKYDPKMGQQSGESPMVTAKGAGFVAEEILRRAKEAGVYIHEDQDLVEILSKVDIGAEIPESLYEAVARVLSLVYQFNKDFEN
tara:strand:- start:1533 stop:1805 length:273 start_codon:yes stop_codon:yes gene_type:complete